MSKLLYGNKTREELIEEHGTLADFSALTRKAADHLFITTKEAEDAIQKYKLELESAPSIGRIIYPDKTEAVGVLPLPELSPRQQDTKTALGLLTDIESMHGRSGATISLRGLIERIDA